MARILAVDDSPSMRQMVNVALMQAGHNVELAGDGIEALRMADAASYDLVITDVNMPNMDGIALVRELRGRPSYKFIPVLMLTTEAAVERKQEGRAAGATGWLTKPFNPERLLATISKVLA